MRHFEPIKKLGVYRRLANTQEAMVGQLVLNKQAVYFQYDDNYLENFQSLSPLQKLASQANFSRWKDSQNEVIKVLDALSHWSTIASELGIFSETVKLISKQLDKVYQQNKSLFR